MNVFQAKGHQRLLALFGLLLSVSLPIALLFLLGNKLNIAHLPQGVLLPSLSLLTIEGRPVSTEYFQGRKSAVLFFTTDCQYCKIALDQFEHLYHIYEGKLHFVSISLSAETKTKFLAAEKRFSFPLLFDPTNRVRELYKISSVPAWFLVDEQHVLSAAYYGARSLEQEKQFIEKFLSYNSPR